jgi:hypothetical protein
MPMFLKLDESNLQIAAEIINNPYDPQIAIVHLYFGKVSGMEFQD